MEAKNLSEILLEDDFFRKLNTEEAFHVEETQMESFWNVLSQQVSTQVISQFGIGRLLDLAEIGDTDSYLTGGAVSTVHNAENDVFVSKEHQKRYNAAYDRKNYEGRKNSEGQDNRISTIRKKDFQQRENIIDGYTGKELTKDGRSHLDHVVAAKRIHSNNRARLFMTDDQRNDMAMDEKNLTFTDSSLNQSKGEHKLSDWRKTTQKKQEKNNEERFGIKPELADKVEARAEKHVQVTVNKAQLAELKQASLKQGMTQMKRQLIGLVLHKLSKVIIFEMKSLVRQWKNFVNTEARIIYFKERMQFVKNNILDSLRNLKDELIGTSIDGFLSGIIGTLITTLINSFITTSARLGRIIQDGLTSILKGFKLLVTNPENLEKDDLIERVIKLIGVGVSVSTGLILTDLIDKQLSAYLPNQIANPIASVIGALFTGSMSAVIIHLVDNFDQVIRTVNQNWRNITTQLTNSKSEIINTYQQAISGIDDEYQLLLQNIAIRYQELDRLSELAFGINSLANVQFEHSVDYAKAMNVDSTKMLQTPNDIDSFFLN